MGGLVTAVLSMVVGLEHWVVLVPIALGALLGMLGGDRFLSGLSEVLRWLP